MEGNQKRLESNQQKLEGNQQQLDGSLGRLQEDFHGFREETRANFKGVFEYLSRIDDELRLIRGEIEDLKKQLSLKADVDRLLRLERRVDELEVQLAKHRTAKEA